MDPYARWCGRAERLAIPNLWSRTHRPNISALETVEDPNGEVHDGTEWTEDPYQAREEAVESRRPIPIRLNV